MGVPHVNPRRPHIKIVRFSQNGHSPRLGCFMGQDRVVDLEASCADWLSARGVVRSAPIAAALFPQSTRGFLEGRSATHDTLAAMAEATKAGKLPPARQPAGPQRL